MSSSTGSYLQLQRGNQSSPNSLHCFGILSESEVSSPGNVLYWIFVKFLILMMYIIMLSSITSFKLFIPVYLNTYIIYVPLSKHKVTFSYVIFNFFYLPLCFLLPHYCLPSLQMKMSIFIRFHLQHLCLLSLHKSPFSLQRFPFLLS